MKRYDLLKRFPDPIQVLDHGFIRLVDVMGDDAAIVQAARVSYAKKTKTLRDDRGLLRYLMRCRHTSPFEQCEIKLHWKLPIFVARQVVRHRMTSLNEVSARYSELPNEMFQPASWRLQSTSNKQGSEGEMSLAKQADADQALSMFQENAWDLYRILLKDGVARELARIVLPVGVYTEWYWKIDLHNLLHFLGLRMDEHAQYETRMYANAIAEIVKVWVPETWEAFCDYQLNAKTFSAPEMSVLLELLEKCGANEIEEVLKDRPWLSEREKDEFRAKLMKTSRLPE